MLPRRLRLPMSRAGVVVSVVLLVIGECELLAMRSQPNMLCLRLTLLVLLVPPPCWSAATAALFPASRNPTQLGANHGIGGEANANPKIVECQHMGVQQQNLRRLADHLKAHQQNCSRPLLFVTAFNHGGIGAGINVRLTQVSSAFVLSLRVPAFFVSLHVRKGFSHF